MLGSTLLGMLHCPAFGQYWVSDGKTVTEVREKPTAFVGDRWAYWYFTSKNGVRRHWGTDSDESLDRLRQRHEKSLKNDEDWERFIGRASSLNHRDFQGPILQRKATNSKNVSGSAPNEFEVASDKEVRRIVDELRDHAWEGIPASLLGYALESKGLPDLPGALDRPFMQYVGVVKDVIDRVNILGNMLQTFNDRNFAISKAMIHEMLKDNSEAIASVSRSNSSIRRAADRAGMFEVDSTRAVSFSSGNSSGFSKFSAFKVSEKANMTRYRVILMLQISDASAPRSYQVSVGRDISRDSRLIGADRLPTIGANGIYSVTFEIESTPLLVNDALSKLWVHVSAVGK